MLVKRVGLGAKITVPEIDYNYKKRLGQGREKGRACERRQVTW